ncbi:helix-turn-helix transcriptional regulator [Mucilaginibacter sp. CAU 1740]
MSTIHVKVSGVTDNIRHIRRAKDYTQAYMAQHLDISQTTYSNIESGSVALTLDRFLAIAQILDVDTKELLAVPMPENNFPAVDQSFED